MQSRETEITMVKWTNAGGQTKRANERSFVYRPPAWRRWRNMKTTYLAIVEEMFHVNSSSNNAKCLKFYRRKVYNSLQEIATLAIIWEISDSNLETTRYSLKSGVSLIIWESWQHCNDYVNLSLIYLSLLKLQWHAKVYKETFHVRGNLRSGHLCLFTTETMKSLRDSFNSMFRF